MAMLIASGGGFVLEMAVEHFKGVTLFGQLDHHHHWWVCVWNADVAMGMEVMITWQRLSWTGLGETWSEFKLPGWPPTYTRCHLLSIIDHHGDVNDNGQATKSLLGTFPEGEDKIMQLPCTSVSFFFFKSPKRKNFESCFSAPCAEICPAVNADLEKRQQEHRMQCLEGFVFYVCLFFFFCFSVCLFICSLVCFLRCWFFVCGLSAL